MNFVENGKKKRKKRNVQAVMKGARFLFTLTLKQFRLQGKGKQSAGREVYNLAVHGKKLLP